jgi:hypothetical protein
VPDEPKVCRVCGAEVDDFGCLGEFRGKHMLIERDALKKDLEAAMAIAELNWKLREECDAKLARLVGRAHRLASEWKQTANGLFDMARDDKLHEPERRARAESYDECADELRTLINTWQEP